MIEGSVVLQLADPKDWMPFPAHQLCEAWGVPATVIHGDALTLEVFKGWRNLFWWSAHGTPGIPIELADVPIEEAKAAVEAAAHQTKTGQFVFGFEEASA